MDLEKVYRDYNWNPDDGDYIHRKKGQEHKTFKKSENKVHFSKIILFSLLIIFLIIEILLIT
jgi:hypothetical protein